MVPLDPTDIYQQNISWSLNFKMSQWFNQSKYSQTSNQQKINVLPIGKCCSISQSDQWPAQTPVNFYPNVSNMYRDPASRNFHLQDKRLLLSYTIWPTYTTCGLRGEWPGIWLSTAFEAINEQGLMTTLSITISDSLWFGNVITGLICIFKSLLDTIYVCNNYINISYNSFISMTWK